MQVPGHCDAVVCCLLTSCLLHVCRHRTFEVTGAAKALRGMWPLVFSKHEPVRGAVLDSWHILHLHEKLPKQQVPPDAGTGNQLHMLL